MRDVSIPAGVTWRTRAHAVRFIVVPSGVTFGFDDAQTGIAAVAGLTRRWPDLTVLSIVNGGASACAVQLADADERFEAGL